MDLAIEAKGLTKKYANVTAVNNIDFQVKKGEIFGFLGPNGAGKTTTQRILTGVITATSGKASILGYDIGRETFRAKNRIGVVPELANIYIDLSAWSNLMLIGQLYGVSEEDRIKKSTELLRIFNLYERKDEKTKVFSKGMKQKLLLCMALIHNPQLLFLDEPTSGLDVVSSRLIREMIAKFNQEGVTIFLTTHNIQEADELCDRIAVIDHGLIATIDSPENLKKEFQSMQAIEVAFNPPIKSEDDLKKIEYVNKVQKIGDKFKLYTDNPDELIRQLLNFSQKRNLNILSLNTLGPDLEEVFVKITEEHKGWSYGKEKSFSKTV